MRTERSDSGSSETPVSRRAFMVASGTVVGTSLGVGTAGAVSDSGEPVEVAATEPYLAAVRDAADTDEGPAVEVCPLDELGEQADVRISGKPTEGGDPAKGVAVQGWAALAHPQGEWRECERRAAVQTQWASDDPVETWSESDWASVSEHGDRLHAARQSDAAAARLVRGTRSYQYAHGRGGAGYYSVGVADLESLPADTGGYTPVARFAYVHVDGDGNDRVVSFLRQYDRRTDDAEDVAGFVDPAVGV